MQKIVISIGGSVLFPLEFDVHFFKKLVKLLHRLSNTHQLFVVVGGGSIARAYIRLGRDLGLPEQTLDSVGIDITRVNAKLLTSFIKISNQTIPLSTDAAMKLSNPIVVMGGTTPGHSTDMVGAELAKKLQASRFVIATNVDGIYDKDPNIHPHARQLPEIHIDELINTYGTQWNTAGKNMVIDAPALRIIKEARIPTVVVNGKRLDQLEQSLIGKPFHGTAITL